VRTTTRIHISGQTYFLKLTGKSRGASFFDAACYRIFLTRFLNCLNSFQVKLHAYSLRTKEIYLLVTPSSPTGISNLLNSINQAYSEYFNERFSRAINVWGGSPLSSPVLEDQFCLNCQKYIERIALRDLDIDHPGAYEWSSYCLNAFGSKARFCPIIRRT
jgi:histidyl-tRNA synthetase